MGGNVQSPLKRLALAKQASNSKTGIAGDFSPSLSSVFERIKRAKKQLPIHKIEKKTEGVELPSEEPVERRRVLTDEEISLLIEEKFKQMSRAPVNSDTGDLSRRIDKLLEAKETEENIKTQEKKSNEGISLKTDELAIETEEEVEAKRDTRELINVNDVFPLITLKKGDKEQTYVWGNIKWVPEAHALRYFVKEPPMSEKELKVFDEIKNILERKLDTQFKSAKVESAFDYLRRNAEQIHNKLGLKLTESQKLKFEYYLYRDFIGLGKIEPLMHDPNIEDISCDGANIPLFIYHRNPKYAGVETDVAFGSQEDLDSFVLKISQKVGKSISIAEPLLDGALPDGSRVQATYGSDIARRGSNFTIRKFTTEPITPTKEMEFKTVNAEILAYLWLAMENGLSVLISGATATGKTSFLNAISLFIKPEAKIVSIEDTPELRLPQPNWVPQVARSGFGRQAYGEVSMFDLLKASLRQRPDFVIVGEVRGKEANVMFQGMATGHAALGTLHADSFSAVYDRLTTRPIELPASMLENLDLIVFLVVTKREGAYLRKVKEVVEVLEYDINTNNLRTNTAFKWDPINNSFESLKSNLIEKMQEKMGVSAQDILQEMRDRSDVLKWLHSKRILQYEQFSQYIKRYYTNKKGVMEEIRRTI